MKANFRDRNVFKVVGTEEMRIEVRIEWDLAKMCVWGVDFREIWEESKFRSQSVAFIPSLLHENVLCL